MLLERVVQHIVTRFLLARCCT